MQVKCGKGGVGANQRNPIGREEREKQVKPSVQAGRCAGVAKVGVAGGAKEGQEGRGDRNGASKAQVEARKGIEGTGLRETRK